MGLYYFTVKLMDNKTYKIIVKGNGDKLIILDQCLEKYFPGQRYYILDCQEMFIEDKNFELISE